MFQVNAVSEYFNYFKYNMKNREFQIDLLVTKEYPKLAKEYKDKELEKKWYEKWSETYFKYHNNDEIERGIKFTWELYKEKKDNINWFCINNVYRLIAEENNAEKGFVIFMLYMVNNIKGIYVEEEKTSKFKCEIEKNDELDFKYKIDLIAEKEVAIQIKSFPFFKDVGNLFVENAKKYKDFEFYIWLGKNTYIYNKLKGWKEIHSKDEEKLYYNTYKNTRELYFGGDK